jgi:aerobic-type carbon monoxide dehydrogenase small subunit (CoxS/CutS family)
MRKVLVAFAVAAAFSTPVLAGGVWQAQCSGCHNGAIAPSKQQLKAKLKTSKAFVDAAQKSNNPMMAAIKNNVQALKDAAKEIYGK